MNGYCIQTVDRFPGMHKSVDRLCQPVDRFMSKKMDGYCIEKVNKPVNRLMSNQNGWLLHPNDQQTSLSFHVEPKWMATASKRSTGLYRLNKLGRLVYLGRFQSINRFIDRKAYNLSFLAPLHILLSFPFSFSLLYLLKSLET